MKKQTAVKPIRTYSKDSALVTERRQHIVQSVTKIIYKQGYNKVSMREIAEACDMAVGTIYRYIGSKDDVLFLVIDEFRSSILAFCDEVHSKLSEMAPFQCLKWAIHRHCLLSDEHRYLLMLSWREIGNMKREYRQWLLQGEVDIVAAFEGILRKGCEAGQFNIQNPFLAAHNIVVLGELWALRQWFLKDKISLKDFIDQQIKFVCHGVCNAETERETY